MARVGRMFLFNRCRVRHLRRQGDLLMGADSRFSAEALIRFAADLLQKAGLDSGPAGAVARTLVEGDLLGHDTHGLALLAPYVREIENGAMTCPGAAQVLADR